MVCKADLQKIKSMYESEYFGTSRPGLEDMNRQMNGWNIWAGPVYLRAKALAKVVHENNLTRGVHPGWKRLKPGWNDEIERRIRAQEKELENCTITLLERINFDNKTAGAIQRALGPLMAPLEERYFWLLEEGGFWRDWLLQLTEQQKRWTSPGGVKNKRLEQLISKAIALESTKDARHQFEIGMQGVKNTTEFFFDVAQLFYDPVGLITEKVTEKVSETLQEYGVSKDVADKTGEKAGEKVAKATKLKNPDPQTTSMSPADVEEIANWALEEFEGSYLAKFDRKIQQLDKQYKEAQKKYAETQRFTAEPLPLAISKPPPKPRWPLYVGVVASIALLGVIFWPSKKGK